MDTKFTFISKKEKPIRFDFEKEMYLSFEKNRWDDHPTSPVGEKGLSARTVNNVIRNLKIFSNHLVREHVISHSPMDPIKYQREAKETFHVFTDEDVT